jgi:hypothetical protein
MVVRISLNDNEDLPFALPISGAATYEQDW